MKKKTGFFIFCIFPLLCNAQLTGLEYQKKSFELDSLLTIANDTSKYIVAFEKIPVSDLLEGEIFAASKVYAKLKNTDKAKYYAAKAMAKGESLGIILGYLNPYLSAKEKKTLQFNECALKKRILCYRAV